jgi:mannose-6-phosphate isomerase-like protein (cupin superfamily)
MLIKGKDVKAERGKFCGCMIKAYPMGDKEELAHWAVVSRTLADEEKWSMGGGHFHVDGTEYWFVIEGKGQITVGDEIYDVEPGDLVITHPLKPHSLRGDITIACCSTLYNKDGECLEGKIRMVNIDRPYRDKPEEQPKAWQCYEIELEKELKGD